jgi:hypothetical protein
MERLIDLVGAVNDADMFAASNGSGESTTTNTTIHTVSIITTATHNAVDEVFLGLLLWKVLQQGLE